MIYHPYFRGKQYELICIRDNSELINTSDFLPIVEPTKSATGSLIRCLEKLTSDDAGFLAVCNPYIGDFSKGLPDSLFKAVQSLIDANHKASWAFIVGQKGSPHALRDWMKSGYRTSVIHAGGHPGSTVAEAIEASGAKPIVNAFIESMCGKLYRNHFKGTPRVLIRDGFQKRTSNKLHPDVEPFSDLHLTYSDEGMDGFGDFLTVGDDYQDSGGPAYAVAIHVTFVDPDQDSAMFIHHFKSISNDTPIDPGNKFREAATKLRTAVEASGSKILRTSAIEEFLDLQAREHYPGLGYVKKLSMQHHLELMSTLL